MSERTCEELLRLAGRAIHEPDSSSILFEAGLSLGEERELSREEIEALLEVEEGSELTVTVIVFRADGDSGDREKIEEALSSFVEKSDLGRWVGSGQGNLGQGDFFDVTFAVESFDESVSAIQSELKELGGGPRAEIHCSDGREFFA